jgi:G3E family GTPase
MESRTMMERCTVAQRAGGDAQARLRLGPRARPAGDAEMSHLIAITVLTGFLDAGKTTLLNRILRHPQFANTAILINEFREVALDHLLVEAPQDEVVLLNSGCLCCNVRSDLVTALRTLLLRRVRTEIPRFERVMIETTTVLAGPAPILHTLIFEIGARYRLDGGVTLVDAVIGEATLDAQPEAVKQTAVADPIVLTKLDLTSSPRAASLGERLRHLNPNALIVRARHGIISPKLLLGLGPFRLDAKIGDVLGRLNAAAYAQGHDHRDRLLGHRNHDRDDYGPTRHDPRIQTFWLAFDHPTHWNGMGSFLTMLVATHGGNLLRVKGLLNLAGQNRLMVIHGAQHAQPIPRVRHECVEQT